MKTLMIPRRTDNLDTLDSLPLGQTHSGDTPCPLTNDSIPGGGMTCCSFNTGPAVKALYEFGKVDLAKALRKDLDVDRAAALARELRRAADLLDLRYEQSTDSEDEMQKDGVINIATGEFIPWSRSAFEETLTTIRDAADWYEKVGRLGFGVHVWS